MALKNGVVHGSRSFWEIPIDVLISRKGLKCKIIANLFIKEGCRIFEAGKR
jgi:hypothetical protein